MSKPTVAILGASSDRSKYGNIALRAHLKQGYHVYPVNPNATEIEAQPVYRTLSDIPETTLDRISVYLPPGILLPLLDEIAATEHRELWLNPGTESPEILQRAAELGLDPIQACSIVDLGVKPSDV